MLGGWHGFLVRDDYAGWHQFDAELAGVGLCGAHLIRDLQGVLDLHNDHQAWAGRAQQILREANQAVTAAMSRGETGLDPGLLTRLRQRFDREISWGRPPTGTVTGTKATTPGTSWPSACTTRPNRSGRGAATSPCPGPTTPANGR